MTTVRAAFYARVSSEQQAAAHTIESQTSALSERARSDGTPVPPERQFVDDGISGATLVRPALDRLRDLATVGAIDKIYVHSPDRLARNYAYQVLLLDEWRRANVEPVFLNKSLGKNPEDRHAGWLDAARTLRHFHLYIRVASGKRCGSRSQTSDCRRTIVVEFGCSGRTLRWRW